MKIKVLVKYLSMGNEEDGVFFIEKRSIGKFLCYKKGEWEEKIKLTKKIYKNLSRFTRTTLEREYDVPFPDSDEESCCGVSYTSLPLKRETSYHPIGKYVHREKARFVMEWFGCKSLKDIKC